MIRERMCLNTVSVITVLIFLWSNLAWAGGVEWYKLSAPSQVTAIVPVANVFAMGQEVVKGSAEEGIVSKEVFYKRLQDDLDKGKAGRLANVPCLVFSDQKDKTKLAYYVFSPKERCFSRITTEPSVNDSLWGFLKTIGIQERTEIGGREFKIGEGLYYQSVYILTDEELGVINTALKLIGSPVVSSRFGVKKEQPEGEIWLLGSGLDNQYKMVNWDEINKAVERLRETHPGQWWVLKRRTRNFEGFCFFDNMPSVAGIYDLREVGPEVSEEERYVFAVDSDLREILASGKLDKDALVDFYYLLLVHEGTELLLREGRPSCETISPDIETEVVAFIEKAKAYLGLPKKRRVKLKKLLTQFDANEPDREDRFMPVVNFIETLQADKVEEQEGVLKVIDFVLSNPDYKDKGMDREERQQLATRVVMSVTTYKGKADSVVLSILKKEINRLIECIETGKVKLSKEFLDEKYDQYSEIGKKYGRRILDEGFGLIVKEALDHPNEDVVRFAVLSLIGLFNGYGLDPVFAEEMVMKIFDKRSICEDWYWKFDWLAYQNAEVLMPFFIKGLKEKYFGNDNSVLNVIYTLEDIIRHAGIRNKDVLPELVNLLDDLLRNREGWDKYYGSWRVMDRIIEMVVMVFEKFPEEGDVIVPALIKVVLNLESRFREERTAGWKQAAKLLGRFADEKSLPYLAWVLFNYIFELREKGVDKYKLQAEIGWVNGILRFFNEGKVKYFREVFSRLQDLKNFRVKNKIKKFNRKLNALIKLINKEPVFISNLLGYMLERYLGLQEGLIYVISNITGEEVEDAVIDMLRSHLNPAVRESAAIILSQWCSQGMLHTSRRLKARKALADVLGKRQNDIFDRYGIWIIDIRVDEQYKFRDDDIDRIEKALEMVPKKHMEMDVCRVILRTEPHTYVELERVPGWMMETGEGGKEILKRVKQFGTYDDRLRIVRINETDEVEETVCHEIGHGVYYFYITKGQKREFAELYQRSVGKLSPVDRRYGGRVDYSDFAYFYGATNEEEDFATIYETWLTRREDVKNKMKGSKLLREKVEIMRSVFPKEGNNIIKEDGFIFRGDINALFAELEEHRDKISDLRPGINIRRLASQLRELLDRDRDKIGDEQTIQKIHQAITDLEKFDIKEFSAIVLGRDNPRQERQWLLGFNSLAPPMTEYLQKLFPRPTLGYVREALDRLQGDGLLEYLLHEALCRYTGHYEARRVQEILFSETNYKDAKGEDGRKEGIVNKVLVKVIDNFTIMVEHLLASFEDEIKSDSGRDALDIIIKVLDNKRYCLSCLRYDDRDRNSIQKQIEDLEELEKSIQAVREGREAKITVDNLAYQALILVVRKWIKRDAHIHINPSISNSWISKNGDIKLTPEELADSIKNKGRSKAIGGLITRLPKFLEAVRFVVQCCFHDNVKEINLKIDPTKEFNGTRMQLKDMLEEICKVVEDEEKIDRKKWEEEEKDEQVGMRIGWLPRVNFVLVFGRADKPETIEKIINDAITLKKQNNELSSRLIGIDLAGFETGEGTFTEKIQTAIDEARKAGLLIMAHAGDLDNTNLSPDEQIEYVKNTIKAIGPYSSMGHGKILGVRIVSKGIEPRVDSPSEDQRENINEILRYMRENNITIECCPRKEESRDEFNISILSKHPVYDWINQGNRVVLGTDGLFYGNNCSLSEWVVRLLLAAPRPQEGFTVGKMKNLVCCFESRVYPMYQGLKEFEQVLTRDLGNIDWIPKDLVPSIKSPPQPKQGIVRGQSECGLREEGKTWFCIFDTTRIKTISRLTEVFWDIYGSWHSSKWAEVYDLFANYAPQDEYGAHNNGFYRGIFKGLFKSKDIVLDVGTGDSGILASIAAEEGAGNVIGIDISPGAIESATQKVKRDNVEFRVGDVLSLNFEQKSFDWVISRFTLYFLPEPLRKEALYQIFRVLKNGGKIKFIAKENEPLEWSDNEWKQALKDVGFYNINSTKKMHYGGSSIYIIDAEKKVEGEMPLSNDLFLREAQIVARQAVVIAVDIMGRFKKEKLDKLRTEQKKIPYSIVTEADKEIQKEVVTLIRSHFPEHGIVGEEDIEGVDVKRNAEYVWVIDPIGGTKSFVDGYEDYCFLLSLLHNGEPVLSLIYAPEWDVDGSDKGALFEAVVDVDGAYLNGKRIYVSTAVDFENQKILITRDREGIGVEEKIIADGFGQVFRTERCQGLDMIRVAMSNEYPVPIVYTHTTPKLWDAVASIFIVTKAGGVVTNFEGNEVLPVNKDEIVKRIPRFPNLIASSPEANRMLLERLKGGKTPVPQQERGVWETNITADGLAEDDRGTMLNNVLKRIRDRCGVGIFAVADKIKVIEDSMGQEFKGPKDTIFLNVNTFTNEDLLYLTLMCELVRSIMSVVPCESDEIRRLAADYISLRFANEGAIKMDDDEMARLFGQFSFGEELLVKIKDAENRFRAALEVFNDIAEAKGVLEKVRETEVKVDRAIKGLGNSIKKIRMVVSRLPVIETGFLDALVRNNKYIMLDRSELAKPENKYIKDWIEKLVQGKERNPFIYSDEDISKGINLEDVIHLVEPEKVNEQLPKNRLYLPLPYSVSSIYLASQVVLAGGKVSQITDKLALNTIRALYETLLGRDVKDSELEELFRMPWKVLPQIVQITGTLNALRKVMQEIEVAA